MNRSAAIVLAREFMQDFARTTGLDPPGPRSQRYLWTDAFAVCNYLGLFRVTGNPVFRELALRLIDDVHHTLGRFRDDDYRTGWISGLLPAEGEKNPVAGGLRIGKPHPERLPGEPYDEQREWDRDGQYYHYLTKWMHALGSVGRVTGNPVYLEWAVGLARTAHARFPYRTGGRMRMYWKMSTDLSYPVVSSMGQHDPLDGFVTYAVLQAAETAAGHGPVLVHEMADMAGIIRDLQFATDDPLGTGGLLSDAGMIARLAARGGPADPELLGKVTAAALTGLECFSRSRCLDLPARNRLAFRELGLSIGLAGIAGLPDLIAQNPQFSGLPTLRNDAEAILAYLPLKETIENFWLADENRASGTWTGHREISTVMLATSLVPDGFLDL
jgi:hypothetical protein